MSDYLIHYGIEGQKHGERRWQNKDGSLTPAGRIHYGVGAARKRVGDGATARGVAKIANPSKGPISKAIGIASIAKGLKRKKNPSSKDIDTQIANLKSRKAEKLGVTTDEHLADRRTDAQKKVAEMYTHKPSLEEIKGKSKKSAESTSKQPEKKDGLLTRVKKSINPSNAQLDEEIFKLEKKRDEVRETESKKRHIAELRSEIRNEHKRTLEKEEPGAEQAKRNSLKDIMHMSDQEVKERINRLKNEIELTDLEASRKMSPVARMVKDQLMAAAKESIKDVAKSTLTDLGKGLIKQAGFEELTAMPKTKKELVKERDEYYKSLSAINQNRNTLANRAQNLKNDKKTISEIARIMGLDESDVKNLLYTDDPKEKK